MSREHKKILNFVLQRVVTNWGRSSDLYEPQKRDALVEVLNQCYKTLYTPGIRIHAIEFFNHPDLIRYMELVS